MMKSGELSHPQLDRPSAWVTRFAGLIAPGEVLDLACGSGRHARVLAGLGYEVTAVDRDVDALVLAAGDGIITLHHDLEKDQEESAAWPFEPARFSGIVVTNYLHRPLFSHILKSLAPGGVLIYETFAQDNGRFGKPSNPDFLLRHGELLEIVAWERSGFMRVIAFEDGYVQHPKPAMMQRICAVKANSVPEPGRLFPI